MNSITRSVDAKAAWIERLVGRFDPIETDTPLRPAMHAEVRDFSPATEYLA